MMAASVSVNLDGLEKTEPAFRRERIVEAAAESVLRAVKDHYAGLSESRPNQQGWKRQNYWQKVGQSAHVIRQNDERRLLVVDKEGAALHLRGGTVRPVRTQWLTLPATEQAYGRRAREFTNLRFVPLKSDFALLVEDAGGAASVISGKSIKGKRQSGNVFYWLKKATHHQPDPATFPDLAALQAAANAAVNALLKRN